LIQICGNGGHDGAMPCRHVIHDRCTAGRPSGRRAARGAGTCSTCSPPVDDLFGHLFPHLLSWTKRERCVLPNAMIGHAKPRKPSLAAAGEKKLSGKNRQEQVTVSRKTPPPPRVPRAPRIHFFACSNPLGVAMLRNIC
jgi:hypothetical protein